MAAMTTKRNAPIGHSSLSIAERRLLRIQTILQQKEPHQRDLGCSAIIPSPINTATATLHRAAMEPTPVALPEPTRLGSHWSPDTTYADTTYTSIDSLQYSLSSGSIDSATNDMAFSETSIDIVHARRQIVKRAQPQMVRLQPPPLLNLDGKGEPSGYRGVLDLFDDYDEGVDCEEDQKSDTGQTSDAVEGDDGKERSRGDDGGSATGCDSPLSFSSSERGKEGYLCYEEQVDQPRGELFVMQTSGSEPNSAALHYYVEFDETGMQTSMHVDMQEARAGASDASTFLPQRLPTGAECETGRQSRDTGPACTTSVPATSSRTSFFHHSSLRRCNSTDNFARVAPTRTKTDDGLVKTERAKVGPGEWEKSKGKVWAPVRAARTEKRPSKLGSPRTTNSRSGHFADLDRSQRSKSDAASEAKALRSPMRRERKPPPVPHCRMASLSSTTQAPLPTVPQSLASSHFSQTRPDWSASEYPGFFIGAQSMIPYAHPYEAKSAAVLGIGTGLRSVPSTPKPSLSLADKLLSGIKRGGR